MGKVFNALLLGTVITIVLWVFNGNGFEVTNLLSLLLNPSGWENSSFWYTTLSAITVGGSIITIGLGTILKQDWLVRAGMLSALSSVTIFPYIALFTFLAGQTNYAASCVTSIGAAGQTICSQLDNIGGIGQIIAYVLVGPLFLYSLWACISWIFSPETTG